MAFLQAMTSICLKLYCNAVNVTQNGKRNRYGSFFTHRHTFYLDSHQIRRRYFVVVNYVGFKCTAAGSSERTINPPKPEPSSDEAGCRLRKSLRQQAYGQLAKENNNSQTSVGIGSIYLP